LFCFYFDASLQKKDMLTEEHNIFEDQFIKYGLVDINTFDPTIIVNLKYASTDNFVGENVYGDLSKAYLEPELAACVGRVQKQLKKLYPGYSLVIFDAARPLSVQKRMYQLVQGTSQAIYVADPDTSHKGGFHNYGMAVDLSILDSEGELLDMGTPFDFFGEEAHVGDEITLLKKYKISREAYKNRMLLYYLMANEGLVPYEFEWWHYQLYIFESDKKKFRLLDF